MPLIVCAGDGRVVFLCAVVLVLLFGEGDDNLWENCCILKVYNIDDGV